VVYAARATATRTADAMITRARTDIRAKEAEIGREVVVGVKEVVFVAVAVVEATLTMI